MLNPIDISSFLSCETSTATKATVAAQIREALATDGLFYASGHAIQVTQEVFAAAKALFSLEDAVKKCIPVKSGGFTRGYIGLAGGESGSKALEVKEAFSYGFNWDPTQKPMNALQGPNVWPDESAFPLTSRRVLEEFYNQMVKSAEAIAKAIFMALDMPEDSFDKFCSEGETISLMRLFHYFPFELDPQQDKYGSSPHTDWGFLTLILQQQDVVGLQHKPDKGEWTDVPPIEGTLMVNGGDYLSLLSGGQFISPLHRVVAARSCHSNDNKTTERYSMVFFYYPNYDAKIPPCSPTHQDYSLFQDQQHESARQVDFKDLSFGDYILAKWQQVFRAGGYS